MRAKARKPGPTDVMISHAFWVTREMNIALENAASDGMYRKDIMRDALEEWLISHGYLDPLRKIAI